MAERVVLIRHGETDWSTDRRHTGRTDLPLNADGERRAARLGPMLHAVQGVETATVLTSPLQRARHTCALAGFGERAVVDDDLAEWDYGEFEGTRTSDLRGADPEWSIWHAAVEKGESLADVGRRADRVVARLDGLDGTAMLFAHAHVLRILAARWCGWPPLGGSRLTLLPAGVSVLGFEREVRVIEHWNVGADRLGGEFGSPESSTQLR